MRRVYLAVLCSVMLVAPAAAQSNVEVNAGVQFDFLTPGARSLAMGGAFIGMADDATAAFVNPAGLRALSRREISFEGRGRDFSIPVAARGRFGGPPTNTGFDRFPGELDNQSQTAGGLSFVSFVYPRPRWAIAGYRHELANFDISVQTEGPFFGQRFGPGETRRIPIRGQMDLRIATYGASGSFNITPQISVGAGIALYDFRMDSQTDRFELANFFAEPVFDQNNRRNYQRQEGEDTQVGATVGALFAPNRTFQVGFVYRQGPEFDIRVASFSAATSQPFPGRDRTGVFHVPDVFGLGVLFRPMVNGTIAVDVQRVQYSRMTDQFVDIFADQGSPTDESALYSVNDATELHAGFEYVFPRRIPIAVRVGYWLDPEHGLVYSGTRLADREQFKDRGDTQHVTAGGGAVFGRFEVNGGVDIAERATTVSFSAVVRF